MLSFSPSMPTPTGSRIVAYAVPNLRSTISATDFARTSEKSCRTTWSLPGFIFLEALPVSPNGKIDRKALPVPGRSRPELDTPLVAAERLLKKIWREFGARFSSWIRSDT